MIASILLTSLVAAGSAHAMVAAGSWNIRADFSGCDAKPPLEVILQDNSTRGPDSLPAPGIAEFKIKSPFAGSLFIKPAGSAGLGSANEPQQVAIDVYEKRRTDIPGHADIWAKAKVIPGKKGQVASVADIWWDTRDVTEAELAFVREQLKLDKEVEVTTFVDAGTLKVFYCQAPERDLANEPAK